ncbi:MAG: type II toxin-antitoxin system death-on-curing family toxin [Cyanobacteriota bacterium]
MDSDSIGLLLLSRREVCQLHDCLILRYGGLGGVRSNSALMSAIESPKAYLSYRNENAKLPELAAVMAYEICKQHPFNDGNKRTAALSIPLFMRTQGIRWRPRVNELIDKMLKVSRSDVSQRMDVVEELAFWIQLSQAEEIV